MDLTGRLCSADQRLFKTPICLCLSQPEKSPGFISTQSRPSHPALFSSFTHHQPRKSLPVPSLAVQSHVSKTLPMLSLSREDSPCCFQTLIHPSRHCSNVCVLMFPWHPWVGLIFTSSVSPAHSVYNLYFSAASE